MNSSEIQRQTSKTGNFFKSSRFVPGKSSLGLFVDGAVSAAIGSRAFRQSSFVTIERKGKKSFQQMVLLLFVCLLFFSLVSIHFLFSFFSERLLMKQFLNPLYLMKKNSFAYHTILQFQILKPLLHALFVLSCSLRTIVKTNTRSCRCCACRSFSFAFVSILSFLWFLSCVICRRASVVFAPLPFRFRLRSAHLPFLCFRASPLPFR